MVGQSGLLVGGDGQRGDGVVRRLLLLLLVVVVVIGVVLCVVVVELRWINQFALGGRVMLDVAVNGSMRCCRLVLL